MPRNPVLKVWETLSALDPREGLRVTLRLQCDEMDVIVTTHHVTSVKVKVKVTAV